MKKIIINVMMATIVVIFTGGVIAEIKDLKQQKKSKHKPYGIYEKYFKRSLDFVLSTSALIVFFPLMLLIAVLVRIKLGKPVIFKQRRPGKDGKVFTLLKFRTMSDSRDENGELLPDIERLGKFGNMLRKTSLDELPELINIAMGNMSIIGPRPLILRYLPYYTEIEMHRHDVRPGLSGLAQTSGRNILSWNERFSYDLEYVNKITFKIDVIIIVKTIQKVFLKEDIVVRGTKSSILDLDVERKLKQTIKEV